MFFLYNIKSLKLSNDRSKSEFEIMFYIALVMLLRR